MKRNIKKRTEMFIETHEITIIRAGGRQQTAYCEFCQSSVIVFPIEEVAAILKINSTDVCRLIETNQFHLTGQHGFALVCANSLRGGDDNHSIQIKRS